MKLKLTRYMTTFCKDSLYRISWQSEKRRKNPKKYQEISLSWTSHEFTRIQYSCSSNAVRIQNKRKSPVLIAIWLSWHSALVRLAYWRNNSCTIKRISYLAHFTKGMAGTRTGSYCWTVSLNEDNQTVFKTGPNVKKGWKKKSGGSGTAWNTSASDLCWSSLIYTLVNGLVQK
jgi:hypothetical protein